MEFHEEKALETAKQIVAAAVENFANRVPQKVFIPEGKDRVCMVGFSTEAIVNALGGTLDPLLDAIKSGAIKGIAGVVGCNNPKIKHDHGHVALVQELIRNDVLVVTTGCNAIACAKVGLMLPEAAEAAGDGLKGVCQSLGVPPVLHMGSCVDISRILTTCAAIANALGVDISDLPVAGAAPEWMSEKAVSIGAYVVSSGIFTVLGTVPPVLGSPLVTEILTSTANDVVGAAFAVETDPVKGAGLMIAHIEKKETRRTGHLAQHAVIRKEQVMSQPKAQGNICQNRSMRRLPLLHDRLCGGALCQQNPVWGHRRNPCAQKPYLRAMGGAGQQGPPDLPALRRSPLYVCVHQRRHQPKCRRGRHHRYGQVHRMLDLRNGMPLRGDRPPSETHKAYRCDRCPDRDVPACVSACPTGALVYETVPEFSAAVRRHASGELLKAEGG